MDSPVDKWSKLWTAVGESWSKVKVEIEKAAEPIVTNVISMCDRPGYKDRNYMHKVNGEFVGCECTGFYFMVILLPGYNHGQLVCTSCRKPVSSLGVTEVRGEDRLPEGPEAA
jgi:hypothetical protein